MRHTLLTVAVLTLALAGAGAVARAATGTPITIQAEDITVADAMDLLARQARAGAQPIEYIFLRGADSTRTVTLSLSHVSFNEALRTILDQADMTYEVDAHGVYRVRAKAGGGPTGSQAGILIADPLRPTGADHVRLVRIPLNYLSPTDVVAWFGGIVLQPRFTPGFGMTGTGRGGFPGQTGTGQPGMPGGFPGFGGSPNSGSGLPSNGFPGGNGGGGGGFGGSGGGPF